MKIVLLQDVAKLGNAGDVVTVKDGYGRNFLIPASLAALANPKNLKFLEHQKSVAEAKVLKELKTHKAVAQRIAKAEVVAKVQVGEEDKMFGAVTTSDIAELLAAQGVEIDRRLIQLDEPIKALGIYTVPIKLHADVDAIVRVKVVKIEE